MLLLQAAMLALSLFNPHAVSDSCTLRLSGKVCEDRVSAPLPEAMLRIEPGGMVTFSDQQGRFQFNALCAGAYRLEIMHAGCDSLHLQLQLISDSVVQLVMAHEEIRIQEISISDHRADLAAGLPSVVLSGRELDRMKGNNLGRMLQKLPGMDAIETGNGIAKPMIHGLQGNRIIIAYAGVKLESQQWGLEHAPELDPYHASEIELVKGPGALRYGTEAMGGAILVSTGNIRPVPGIYLKAQAAFHSVSLGTEIALSAEGRPARFPAIGWKAWGTVRAHGQTRSPTIWLANTGLMEYQGGAQLEWKHRNWQTELWANYYQARIGLYRGAHIGNLTDLQAAIEGRRPVPPAEAGYRFDRPYQWVSHQIIRLQTSYSFSRGKFQLNASRQFNDRREYDLRSYGSERPAYTFSIQTWQVGASLSLNLDRSLQLETGIDGSTQTNEYDYAYFIPAFWNFQAGAYLILKKHTKAGELEAGFRTDYRWIQNFLPDSSSPRRQYVGPAFSLGFDRHLPHGLNLAVHLGSSWRMPQAAEWYARGLEHGASVFVLGDQKLRPEWGLQQSLSLGVERKLLKAGITAFAHPIFRFIYTMPQGEPVLTLRGAFPQFSYRQANALLAGTDGWAEVSPVPFMKVRSSFSLIWGRNLEARDWLPLMPPFRISQSMRFEFEPDKRLHAWYAEAGVDVFFRQNNLPRERELMAPPATAFPVYLEAGTAFRTGSSRIYLELRIENLANARYRLYLDSWRYFTDRPGIGATFKLRVPVAIEFKNKKNKT